MEKYVRCKIGEPLAATPLSPELFKGSLKCVNASGCARQSRGIRILISLCRSVRGEHQRGSRALTRWWLSNSNAV